MKENVFLENAFSKATLLQGKHIRKSFGKGEQENVVLNDISVDIYEGDFTVVMGASGAGKSTLLYSLSGMDGITGGQVFYRGKDMSRYKEKQMARLRTREFGFVFQQTYLVSNLTLFENVAVAGYAGNRYCKSVPAETVKKRAWELLARMGVEKAGNRLPSQVSGGEAQRTALARAVMNEPGLVFADEPTGALNKANSKEVLALLTSLNGGGQSILMVTHDVKAAVRGTRLLYMEDGSILDTMEMPVYREEDQKSREEEVKEWLSALQW